MSGEDVRRDLLEPHLTVYGLGRVTRRPTTAIGFQAQHFVIGTHCRQVIRDRIGHSGKSRSAAQRPTAGVGQDHIEGVDAILERA